MTAATKLRTLETALKVMGMGEEGYEKPNKAQTANTKYMDARANKVYLDKLIRGVNVKSGETRNLRAGERLDIAEMRAL